MVDMSDPSTTDSNAPFRRHPARFFDDLDAAAAAIVRHLDTTSGHFDRLSQQSDPQRITADDIVACSMLDYSVPAPAAAWILSAEGQWLTTEILADIPSDDDLWSCGAPSILRAADLFQLLRAPTSQLEGDQETPALGQATATRLLAAKRPRLVPIDDRQIRQTLRYKKDALWFRRWRDIMDDELIGLARTARHLAGSDRPAAVSLSELRVLDIVVRQRARERRR
jgi:hypothetical protein